MIEDWAVKYRPQTLDEICGQQVNVELLKERLHSPYQGMIFYGSSGCGKTTMARALGNELKAEMIELDAASNSSVDDVRELLEYVGRKSLSSQYKIFLIDECFEGSTEVLTDKGFVRFDSLTDDYKIAQVGESGKISFVLPTRRIKRWHDGELVKVGSKNWGYVRMTPNHIQPVYNKNLEELSAKEISKTTLCQGKGFRRAFCGTGTREMTALDRLAIAAQADATLQRQFASYNYWTISLKLQNKIDRLLSIFKESGVEYKEIKASPDRRRFSFKTPKTITKNLWTHFDLSFSKQGARDFIEEICRWDGSLKSGYDFYYSSKVEENVNLVSSLALLGGISSAQATFSYMGFGKQRVLSCTRMMDEEYKDAQYIDKEYEEFHGNVYCVEVPTHRIVVRKDGYAFETGNCHMLSKTAWNALLKTIEEPPKGVLFIFCTTEYKNLPQTILGRAQLFKFYPLTEDELFTLYGRVSKAEGFTLDKELVSAIIARTKNQARDFLKMLQKVVDSKVTTTQELDKITSTPPIAMAGAFLQGVLSNDSKLAVSALKKIKTPLLEWRDRLVSLIYEMMEDNFGISELGYSLAQATKLRDLAATYKPKLFGYILRRLLAIHKEEEAFSLFFALALEGIDYNT